MVVVIVVMKGCEDCIFYYVDVVIWYGVGESEIVEVFDVVVEMGGGLVLMYVGKVLEFVWVLCQLKNV